MSHIRVIGWETYQHYKDRNPPWIKLHREMLTSNTWVSLDDASRVLAVALMLLAAATGNRTKAEPAYLRRVAYLNQEPNLRPLVEVGFIEIVGENGEHASDLQASASTMQADARPETEQRQSRADTEKKEEGALTRSLPKRGSRLSEGWEPKPEGRAFAQGLGLNFETILAKFRDHWTAETGTKASKLDWDAAWRTWCRKEIEFSRGRSPAHSAERGAYVAPIQSEAKEANRLATYAEMIKKGSSPGMGASQLDIRKLIRSGQVTAEQCQAAGCPA